MSDDDIKSRADILAMAPPSMPRGTLPPAAKTWTVIMDGLERIAVRLGLPAMCLIAAKFELMPKDQLGYAFSGAIAGAITGHFALRGREPSQDR